MPLEPVSDDSTDRLSVWYDAVPAEESAEGDSPRVGGRAERVAFVVLVLATIGVLVGLALT